MHIIEIIKLEKVIKMSYREAFTMSDTLRMMLNKIKLRSESFTEIKKQVKHLAIDTVWGEEKTLRSCEIALLHAASTRSWSMLERHFRNACLSYGAYFDLVKEEHKEHREKGYADNLEKLLEVVKGTSFEQRVNKAISLSSGTSAHNKLLAIEHELRIKPSSLAVKAKREKETGEIADRIPEGATHYSKRDGGSFYRIVDNHVSEWFWDEWIRISPKNLSVDAEGIWKPYEMFGGCYSIFRKAVNGLIQNFPFQCEEEGEAEALAMKKNQSVFSKH